MDEQPDRAIKAANAPASETLDTQPASRLGSTRIELLQEAVSPPPTFRVVFSPRNTNTTSWISEDVDG